MSTKLKILWVSMFLGTVANAAYLPTVSVNNFNAVGVYNSTAPTLSNGATSNLQLDVNGNLHVVQSTAPTGSATSALQTAGNALLTTISGQLPATLGQKTMANSLPIVIASDQAAIPVTSKAAVNSNASGSSGPSAVTTSVTTLTAPTNAVGFILMNLDTSTANIRWAIGRTVATNNGQQLQPGRDTGFVPSGATVTIIAESGTQNYDVQWISQ